MAGERWPECKEGKEEEGEREEKEEEVTAMIKIRKETGWGERATKVGKGRRGEGWVVVVDSLPACKTVGCFPLVGLALGYDACTTTVHRVCWCHDFTSFYGDSIVCAVLLPCTCTLYCFEFLSTVHGICFDYSPKFNVLPLA